MTVDLRAAAREDIPLVAGWLAEPHVTRWWGTAVDAAARYGPRIDGEQPVDVLVVLRDGQPVGLLQRQHLAAAPEDRARLEVLLPALDLAAAVDVDYLIGDPTTLRTGVATAALTALVADTRSAHPEVQRMVAVAEADNVASRRTAERAGFAAAWSGPLPSDVAGAPDEDVVVHVLELGRGFKGQTP